MRNEILLVQSKVFTAYWEEEELWEHSLLSFLPGSLVISFNCPLTSQLFGPEEYLQLCVVHVSVYLCDFICEFVVGDPPWVRNHGPAAQPRVCGNIVTLSPTLDPIMVLEILTFLPRSVIAGGKRRHVWITTATWIHAWITTAMWSMSPWLQAAGCASLFSHTLPPLLSLLPLLLTVSRLTVCCHIDRDGHKYTHTLTCLIQFQVVTQSWKQPVISLLRRHWSCFVACLFLPPTAAHSQGAEIDSLSGLIHNWQYLAQPDSTTLSHFFSFFF